METAAVMIIGAIVNAVAFTAGNYLFSLFDSDGAKAESRARSKASVEIGLQNQERQKRLDYLQETISKEQKAEGEFQNVDEAWKEYVKVYNTKITIDRYYQPSEKQRKYETEFIIFGFLAALILYKLLL